MAACIKIKYKERGEREGMKWKRKSILILFAFILVMSSVCTAMPVRIGKASNTNKVADLASSPKPKVSVYPENTINLTLLPPAESLSLTLRPDTEGTKDEWTGVPDNTNQYTNWDETIANDDTDYNCANSDSLYQSSSLADHSSEAWNISKVKVTVWAKANKYSDDKLILMLIIGGKVYDGVTVSNVSTTYTKYTSTWGLNPATKDQWTWAQIDALQAGVSTYTDVSWETNLEIRVSQLYAEVLGPGVKFDVKVDQVAKFWQWQFEMWYNPDVLRGVFADEGNGRPVGADPDGFLATNLPSGVKVDIVGGPGWNNTMGKLWLTGASVQKAYAVTGGPARLAVVMMEVVGKGETYLQLGTLTLVFNTTTYIEPTLGHGYFRNVAKDSLPKPSFTKTPQIAPDPIEGYNVTFDASASTPDGGAPIVEYKWYFGANFPSDTVDKIITKTTPTVSYNYTVRSPSGKVYNVTLTVKDSDGIVASNKTSFIVKAHDIYVGSPILWGVLEGWPATPAKWNVTVGETAKLNVTIENHGNYTESSIEVDCWYQYPGGSVTPIGTHTVTSLSAVAKVNVTFTWATSGLTVLNQWYTAWANATKVPYEYRKTDNTGSTAGVRVKGFGVSISISVSSGEVTFGQSVTISGSITPALADKTLYIMCQFGLGSWSTLSTVQTNAAGEYSHVWKPAAVGTYNLKTKLPSGVGYPSAESTVATVAVGKGSSSISVSVSSGSLAFGQNVTVSGSITPVPKVPVGNRVTIWCRLSDAAVWGNLTVVQTNAAGEYSHVWKPAAVGTYKLYASWPGDSEYLPKDSDVKTVVVNKASSSISVGVSPGNVTIGQTTTVSGSITPVRAGKTVTVWYKTSGAAAWSNLTVVQTNVTGGYSYVWTPAAVGTYQLKASCPEDSEYLKAESSFVTVVVGKMPCAISIDVSPKSITLGYSVTISGAITPVRPGATIMISVRTALHYSWDDITTFQTDANGHFSYDWIPTDAATFEIIVEWNGDATTLGAKSPVASVTVNREAPPDFTLAIVAVVVGVIFSLVILVYFVKFRKPSKPSLR